MHHVPAHITPDFHFTGVKSFIACALIVFLGYTTPHGMNEILGNIASALGIIGSAVVIGMNLDRWYNFRKELKQKNKKP